MDNDPVDQQDDANNYDDPPNFGKSVLFMFQRQWSWCIYIIGEMNDDDDVHRFDHPVTDEDEPSSSSAADELLYFQIIEQYMKEYTASAQVHIYTMVKLLFRNSSN